MKSINMYQSTGKQFKQARLAAGLTQTQAGKLINRHYRTVQRWEANELEVPPEVLELFLIKIKG